MNPRPLAYIFALFALLCSFTQILGQSRKFLYFSLGNLLVENVKSFLKLVKSYTEPQKLTPEILHMFIKKIVVHDPDWSSGHRIQQIDIHYNFVGQLDMSVEMTRTRRRNKKKNRNILSTYQQAI